MSHEVVGTMNLRNSMRCASLLAAFVVVVGCGSAPFSGQLAALKQSAGDVQYELLIPDGDDVEDGFYDPSLAFDEASGVGWMAYSSVTGDYDPLGPYVHTHLAKTADRGATWDFIQVINASRDGTIPLPDGGSLDGVWRYEVPSLVHDADDPDPARRWKLFIHEYFWSPEHDRMVQYGWVAMQTAADPGGEWTAPKPLFGAGEFPLPPYDDTPVDLNILDPSLEDAAAYTEPGALARDGVLYVSMTVLKARLGLSGVAVDHVIALFASDDHGRSWRFVSTLLSTSDAEGLGAACFDGTSLALEDDRVFLLAAPMEKARSGDLHHGTAAFEFESLQDGTLRRDESGIPVVSAYFAPQPELFSGPGAGQSAYHSGNSHGGVLISHFNLKAYPSPFQIYETGRGIVDGVK